MRYDLFVSYSRRDDESGRVAQLVDRIRADFEAFAGRPLGIFFDVEEIQGMEDWRHRILQGLRESRLLLACLSPAYIESDYCEWEFNEYLKHEIGRGNGGDGIAPIYFVEVPGWDRRDFDAQCAEWVSELRRRLHFDLRPWFVDGEEALRDSDVRHRMRRLNQQLAERIQRGERADHSPGNVDAHNGHFIGRVVELRRLREATAQGQVGVLTAVHGLGGVGKTALAIEYAHAFAHEYGGGRWQLRCEGKDDLRAVLAELGTPLGIEYTDEERLDLDRQFERVLREMRRLAESHDPHRCLVLLDNVDEPKLLEPAQTQRLPAADWLHVVATTRLGQAELFGTRQDRAFLPVDELPDDDALELIESYQPDRRFRDETERTAAVEIVRLLAGFTLAVEAAAVYLGECAGDISCAAFLERLRREGLEGLDAASAEGAGGIRHGEKRLGATLRPTLERLRPPELLALRYAALLPPDHVALPWLRELVAAVHPEFGQDAEPGYPDPWRTLLRRLFSQRLLQPTGAEGPAREPRLARMHRLVQALVTSFSTGRPQSEELQAEVEMASLVWDMVAGAAVERIVIFRAGSLKTVAKWNDARWELVPLDAMATQWADSDHPSAAVLANAVGESWRTIAEWGRAERQLRRALELEERIHGTEHPNVAMVLNNLAVLLQESNRIAEAEPTMVRAVNIFLRYAGEEHPSVAACLKNLARIFLLTNRIDDAEDLLTRALAICETNYGPGSPEVADCHDALCQFYLAARRLPEAESAMEKLFAITQEDCHSEHPETAVRMSNLAGLLWELGRLSEAESLMRRALVIDEKFYGPNHHSVALCLNNLAGLLRATNRFSEAEPLMRRALAIDEIVYDPDHPVVAMLLNNLAGLLQFTSRLTEAEPMFRRAVAIHVRFAATTGHLHIEMSKVVNNYAKALGELGHTREEVVNKINEMARNCGLEEIVN